MLEEAAAADDGVIDAARRQHRADRLVARTQALGNGDDIGHHAILFAREQVAGTAHA
ncbi:hypothetical protein D3C80_2040090 [compost metagenome]